MSEIQNTGPVSPREKKMYEKEYQQGAILFEKALQHANKSTYAPKKEKFDEVMKKAMDVLNQAAGQLKRQDLIEQNKKISQDYKAYQASPTQGHLEALKSDLTKAKNSFE